MMRLTDIDGTSQRSTLAGPLKIDLHYESRSPCQIGVYRRASDEFRHRDIELRFKPDLMPDPTSSADLFVLQENFWNDSLERNNRRVIIEERADTSMPRKRQAIKCSNVIACFKPGLVKEEWINLPVHRPHVWVLDKREDRLNRSIFTSQDIAKIRPGFCLGMYDRMQRWITRAEALGDVVQWDRRPIDVLFAGTTIYRSSTITAHRCQFVSALKSITGLKIFCEPSRAMKLDDYFRLSQLAKVIVSPWGHGELCYRDFEALLDGCVLVKPRTDFVQTVGNFLREGETYLPCAPDASDLATVIQTALANGAIDESQRTANRIELLQWWQPKTLVNWWLSQIHLVDLI